MDTRPPSPWFTAFVCSLLVAAAAGAGFYKLHAEMVARDAAVIDGQHDEIKNLTSRIGVLETQATALAQAQSQLAHPDTAPIDALKTQLTESEAHVADLTARLEALEKKPAIAPTPPPLPAAEKDTLSSLNSAVRSGRPFVKELAAAEADHSKNASLAGLRSLAEKGVPTDDMLRQDLKARLEQLPAALESVKDDSLLGKLNTHFAGFITIKKQTVVDSYATLQRDAATADITSLAHEVAALPEAQRAPFADWLASVRSQRDAYIALDSLTPAPGH